MPATTVRPDGSGGGLEAHDVDTYVVDGPILDAPAELATVGLIESWDRHHPEATRRPSASIGPSRSEVTSIRQVTSTASTISARCLARLGVARAGMHHELRPRPGGHAARGLRASPPGGRAPRHPQARVR